MCPSVSGSKRGGKQIQLQGFRCGEQTQLLLGLAVSRKGNPAFFSHVWKSAGWCVGFQSGRGENRAGASRFCPWKWNAHWPFWLGLVFVRRLCMPGCGLSSVIAPRPGSRAWGPTSSALTPRRTWALGSGPWTRLHRCCRGRHWRGQSPWRAPARALPTREGDPASTVHSLLLSIALSWSFTWWLLPGGDCVQSQHILPAELRGALGIIEATVLIKQRSGKGWKCEMTEQGGMRALEPGRVFLSLSPLVCGWEDNLGAMSGEEGADKQERSWNWKHTTDGPPSCCWELTWALSFSCPFPQTGQPLGIWRFLNLLTVGDSLRVHRQGTWVKSVAWRRSGSSGKVRVPLASPHLMWTPFFTGHLALFGGLFDKGLLGLVRVVSFSNLKTGFSVTANEWFYFVHLFQLNFMRFGVLVVFPSFMLSFLRLTVLWYS